MKKNWLAILFSLIPFLAERAEAQRIYVLDEKLNIGFIDVAGGCQFSPLCQISQLGTYTDLAFHPNGNLYILGQEGQLYTLDTTDCAVNQIGEFPNGTTDYYTSLTANADGDLFAAGVRLARYRPSSGQFDDLGALPSPWGWASGDLTYRDGKLYLVTQQNAILKVKIGDPDGSAVLFTLDVPPASEVYGIVTAASGCNSQETFATVSEPGGQHFLYWIDFKNESAEKLCPTPRLILGATTLNEYYVSDCDSTSTDPPPVPSFAVYIPNVFSPDDNGRNDFFTPFVDPAADPTVELLRIYDRWGGLVFEKKDFKPNNEPDGWNGSWNNTGKKVLDGAYVYYCQIGFANGSRLVKTGSITVAKSIN